MHLQDAYFAEKEDTGDGTAIGFKAPASNVFGYDVTKGQFQATNNSNLDDCTSSSTWTVASAKGGAGGGLAHTATIGGSTAANCKALTPSFEDIGKGSRSSS